MEKHCPVTKGALCHCDELLPESESGKSERSVLRRLFADHGIYFSALVMNRLPEEQPGSDAIVTRLQDGAADLARVLEPTVGSEKANALYQAFLSHLDLSGSMIADPNEDTIADFVVQGQDEFLPAFLDLCNSDEMPEDSVDDDSHNRHGRQVAMIEKLVAEHVNIDVQLVLARANGDAVRFIDLNDRGLMHLKQLADTIYNYVFVYC